ncbi:MAG: hypothetical protein MUC50_10845 [Myxococcota bacterium]|jgi:chromosome segregation ATPase|nr:hypothetical protein [Myxococcota bacterium]
MKKAIATCILVTVFVLGCDSKVDECNQMTSVINPFAEELKGLEKAFGAESPDAMKAPLESAAKAAEDTASKLAALNLKKEELKKFSADYQAMCNEMASAAAEMNTIMTQIGPMQKAAEESAQKSQEANTKLGTTCSSNPKLKETCQKITELLSSLPSDPTQSEAANAKIAELKALQTDNADLKTAIGEVAGQLESMVKATGEFMAVQKKLEEVAKKAESATTKETPIIEGLNSYCQAP